MSKFSQTIDQALMDGENAIGPALADWCNREASARAASGGRRTGPYEIRVGFQLRGEGRRALLELTWTAEQAVSGAVPGLMAEVKERLVEVYGPSPMGKLRVLVYHVGESLKTERNFVTDRTIAPDAEEEWWPGAGDGELKALRLQNAQLHNTVISGMAHMATALQAATTMTSQHASALATASTARTAASAASDAGGFWGVASLVAVAVTWPILQEAMGVRELTLPDMLKLFRSRIHAAIAGDKARLPIEETQVRLIGNAPQPPDGASAEPGAQPSGATNTPAEDVLATVRRVMGQARQDPEVLRAIVGELKGDEQLKRDAMMAFAGA
jgi:hypothetical protein